MTLRRKHLGFLLIACGTVATLGLFLGRLDVRLVLLAEALVLLLGLLGWRVHASIFEPLELLAASRQLLAEGELTTRLLPVGHPEMDQLIAVYNQMVDRLRGERVRMEEQQLFLAKLIEATPTAIVVLDHDGRLALANGAAAQLLGRPAHELRGLALGALPGLPAELEAVRSGDAAAFALPGMRRVRIERGTFLDRGFPRTFFVIHELTEELRKAERSAYNRLVRLMAHEIRNTVAATTSLLHSCLRYGRHLPEEDRGDFEMALSVANDRAARLNALMGRFADAVRVPPPELRPTDVAELCHGLAPLLRSELARHGVSFDVACHDAVGTAELDRAQIEQVLLNVVRNAGEASGPGGRVRLTAGRRDGGPFIDVEDSGPPIPPEVRESLFTPFFSTKKDGQGLGLTFVQEVLSQHGFPFALDGPPTRFRIRLSRS